MDVRLLDILNAREARARRQQALLSRYQKPLICFTMNIAGPVKVTPAVRGGFLKGGVLLLTRLAEEHCPDTGCEGYYVVDAPADRLKAITCAIEENLPLGRLFDMDVLTPAGQKLERPTPRRCLLCDNPAALCGSRRAHSVEALQAATASLLAQISQAELIGLLAQKALILEVCCTPKPGLVDRRNSGSHRDMDIFTFFRSIAALGSYFQNCAATGVQTAQLPPEETFRQLRRLGVSAEADMLWATGGVNTHKGAVFTLGLFCGAAGRLQKCGPEALCTQIAAMTAGVTARDFAGVTPANAVTAGQRLYAQYGITGIRGEAEAGFPAVLHTGLPTLEAGMARGADWNGAGCAALLAILARADDTNLIHRSSRETQLSIRSRLQALLRDTPFPTREALEALDEEFIRKNLSPGGSADLLAASFFLYMLKTL